MKLSEMNTMDMMTALCRMAEPLEHIGNDEKVVEAVRTAAKPAEGTSRLQQATQIIGRLLPALLDTHRVDTLIVLSALTGKSVEEIERQNGLVTLRDVKESVDGDLLDFFMPSGNTAGGR